jgi:hypothetical protein
MPRGNCQPDDLASCWTWDGSSVVPAPSRDPSVCVCPYIKTSAGSMFQVRSRWCQSGTKSAAVHQHTPGVFISCCQRHVAGRAAARMRLLHTEAHYVYMASKRAGSKAVDSVIVRMASTAPTLTTACCGMLPPAACCLIAVVTMHSGVASCLSHRPLLLHAAQAAPHPTDKAATVTLPHIATQPWEAALCVLPAAAAAQLAAARPRRSAVWTHACSVSRH